MKRRSLSHLFTFWRWPVRLSEAGAEEAARRYDYWAVVDENHPVTAPWALVRRRGFSNERA